MSLIKDSNNVDSEIHYFKDGSTPLFCRLGSIYSSNAMSRRPLHHHHSCSSSSCVSLRTIPKDHIVHVNLFGLFQRIISYMCDLSDSSISCLFGYFVLFQLNSSCFRIEGNSYARINFQYFQGFAVKLQLNWFLHKSWFF